MNELKKLREARYFFRQMESNAKDRQVFTHNLSAFLTATRSVLQYANKEACQKQGGQVWFDSAVQQSKTAKFFRDQRNSNIHAEPIAPTKKVVVTLVDSFTVTDSATVALVRNGVRIPSEEQPYNLAPVQPPLQQESKCPIKEQYRFKNWRGPEDVVVLCRQYLYDVGAVVTSGQKLGFLATDAELEEGRSTLR